MKIGIQILLNFLIIVLYYGRERDFKSIKYIIVKGSSYLFLILFLSIWINTQQGYVEMCISLHSYQHWVLIFLILLFKNWKIHFGSDLIFFNY